MVFTCKQIVDPRLNKFIINLHEPQEHNHAQFLQKHQLQLERAREKERDRREGGRRGEERESSLRIEGRVRAVILHDLFINNYFFAHRADYNYLPMIHIS